MMEGIKNPYADFDFSKGLYRRAFAGMDERERANYELDLNDYRTYMASLETAKKNGIKDAKFEVAQKMKVGGLDNATIAKYTELTEEEIQKLD